MNAQTEALLTAMREARSVIRSGQLSAFEPIFKGEVQRAYEILERALTEYEDQGGQHSASDQNT